MGCSTPGSSHYAGCDCNEAHWQNEVARLTRERDEARERAAEVPGLRLRLAQTEDSATQAEAAWKAEYSLRLAAEKALEEAERERGVLGEHYALEIKALHAAESRAARPEAALALICDTSERDADVCICEMKRIARAALGEEGK